MQGILMLQYCCAGMLACVSNVVDVQVGVVAGSGATGAITPQDIHTFPAQIARASRLTHALYCLHDMLQLIPKLRDLPYEIETSDDDCSVWTQ